MKQEFGTKLIPQDIVVRQDGDESTFIEENASFWFPLVRVKDTVFGQQDIISFNYQVGVNLIPSISITISDNSRKFMEGDFPDVDDVITIRISNNKDTIHKPIKLDFIIIDIDTSTDSRTINIEALQYIPILHEDNNVGFNDSLFNITKDIAIQCGLGFVTNINDSNDVGQWICLNNYNDFLKYIQTRMYISDDDTIKIFIDQFNNLNVVSLKTAISDRTIYKLLTNPSSGDEYTENVDLKLSNKHYVQETDLHVQINMWSPTTNFGYGFLTTKEIIEYRQKSSEKHFTNEFQTKSTQNVNALINSKDVVYSNYVDGDTVFGNILTARKQNERLRNIFYQGTYINCELEFYIPDIFCYMHSNVDIWNKSRNEEIISQNEDLSNEDLSNAESDNKTNEFVLNKTFTSSYLVIGMEYIYYDDGSNLKQNVNLLKLTNE